MSARSDAVGDGADNAFLARLRLLTTIDEAELAALDRACGPARQVRARADLVKEGDQSGRMHVLLDGWACRYKLLPDGRRQIAALLLPGDICDIDTLHLRRADCAVATLTACTVATVDRATLRALAAEHRGIADALGWLGAVDNAMLTERNAGLGRRTARGHLAHLLCELRLRLQVVGRARDDGFPLPITQEEIADVLGLTAVHVNRVMQGLRSEGVIAQCGRDLSVLDWKALQREAEFRPAYLHLDGAGDGAVDGAQPPRAIGMGWSKVGQTAAV